MARIAINFITKEHVSYLPYLGWRRLDELVEWVKQNGVKMQIVPRVRYKKYDVRDLTNVLEIKLRKGSSVVKATDGFVLVAGKDSISLLDVDEFFEEYKVVESEEGDIEWMSNKLSMIEPIYTTVDRMKLLSFANDLKKIASIGKRIK